MTTWSLRYTGHLPGVPLVYFTGASVTLVLGEAFPISQNGLVSFAGFDFVVIKKP